ncbi:unnamed protein product [Paramecium sonneborni]|uniref:non-specific serine/threonine protein kinase n=1 Tax=Paramecium sonneborni TaxID=65129 RepID=A0A8S1MGC2_9CILI|nr:unnamed protein product [Paramecium sonneborni]
MSQYDLIIEKLTTNLGCLFEMEEKQNDKKTKLFAFSLSDQSQYKWLEDELSNQAQIQKTKLLRHYQKILDLHKKYYLFEYVEGKTIQSVIHTQRVKQESIPLETINNYLTKLLEALFYLHKMDILGRVFSIGNIIENQNNITLMDFGFAPEILQNSLDILAPPEIISKIVDNSKRGEYGIEIDAWLLGAFLFNLVKLYPINSYQVDNRIKEFKYSQIREYHQFLQQQMKNSKNIKANSSRYPLQLTEFIESLLKYDYKERISFSEIYQSEYIKSLKLEKNEEYLSFYENLNLNEIKKKIQLRDGVSQDDLIYSGQLTSIEVRFPNIPKIQIQSVVPNMEDEEYHQNIFQQPKNSSFLELPFMIQNNNKDQKFAKLIQIINMEQFRYFILINTANDVVTLLSNKQFGLELAVNYFLKKMGYLILHEMIAKLNEKKCPWTYSQAEWQEFQIIDVKKTLISEITQTIQNDLKELKILFDKCYNDIIKNEKLDEIIRNTLKQDQSHYQSNKNPETNIFGCTSNEFLKSGYRNMTQHLYNFLVLNVQFDDIRTKQYSLLLKTVLCHLINRIFSYDQLNTQFKNIRPLLYSYDIAPEDIFQFIESKNNDELKINEIQHLVNKYFQ